MDKIAIILLNYNNYEDTLECVKSIHEKCKIPYEIIVVDNASQNECIKQLKKHQNLYKLILNPENSGFASGNNLGIKYALNQEFEYILLLNNDTLITENAIEDMYNIINQNSNIGIVSSTIMYYPEKERIWFNGGYIDYSTYIGRHKSIGELAESIQKQNHYSEVTFLSGCCMMIKKEVFEEVGLLPEEYFMYFEDVDFCLSVQRKKYKLVISNLSKIYHKVSASSGGENSPFIIKWGNRNRLILINKNKKNMHYLHYIKVNVIYYSTRVLKALQYILKGDISSLKALLEGVKLGREYIKNKI